MLTFTPHMTSNETSKSVSKRIAKHDLTHYLKTDLKHEFKHDVNNDIQHDSNNVFQCQSNSRNNFQMYYRNEFINTLTHDTRKRFLKMSSTSICKIGSNTWFLTRLQISVGLNKRSEMNCSITKHFFTHAYFQTKT